jgi:hypothetical protein
LTAVSRPDGEYTTSGDVRESRAAETAEVAEEAEYFTTEAAE